MTPTPTRRRPAPGAWTWFAGALLLAAACSGSGDRATTTTSSSAPDEPVTTMEPPTRASSGVVATFPDPAPVHEIVYRVERLQTGVVDTEIRLARHPFEARVETHAGEPADVDDDAEPRLLDLEVLGGVETGALGQERVLVVAPPRPAFRAGHLGTDVEGAIEAGVLEPLDLERTIADRDCTELRTGAPLDGGILRPPSVTDHNEICVDDEGYVLREEVTTSGTVVERRTAVEVDLAPPVPDLAFAPLGWRIPEGSGGGRVRQLRPDSRPPEVDHYELAAPPPGMELLGRFGVLTDAAPGPNPAGAVDQVVSMVDVYVGDGDVVTIENGASVTGGAVLGRGDVDVPLSFAPDATALFLTTGVELRAPLPTGRFLKITATTSLDELTALAESLVVVGGPGEVVPLDEQPDITGRLASPAPDHDHDDDAGHDHDDARPEDHHHG